MCICTVYALAVGVDLWATCAELSARANAAQVARVRQSMTAHIPHADCNNCLYLSANSTVNQITTRISMRKSISMAWISYSSIVEKTLKAKHVNTIKNLQRD